MHKNKNKNKNKNIYNQDKSLISNHINHKSYVYLKPYPFTIFLFVKSCLLFLFSTTKSIFDNALASSVYLKKKENEFLLINWFSTIMFVRYLILYMFFSYLNAFMLKRSSLILRIAFRDIGRSQYFDNIEKSIINCINEYVLVKEITSDNNAVLFDYPFKNDVDFDNFVANFIELIRKANNKEKISDCFVKFITFSHYLLCCIASKEGLNSNFDYSMLFSFIFDPLQECVSFIDLYKLKESILLDRKNKVEKFIVTIIKEIKNIILRKIKKKDVSDIINNLKSLINSDSKYQYGLLGVFNNYIYESNDILKHIFLSNQKNIFKNIVLFDVIGSLSANNNNYLSYINNLIDNNMMGILNKNRIYYKRYKHNNVFYNSSQLGNSKLDSYTSTSTATGMDIVGQDKESIKSQKKSYQEILDLILSNNYFINKMSSGREIKLLFNNDICEKPDNLNNLYLTIKSIGFFDKKSLEKSLDHKEQKGLYKVIRDIDIELSLNDQDFESLCLSLGSLILDIKNDNCYIIGFDYDARDFNSIIISFFQKNCLVPIDINILKANKKSNNKSHNLNTPNLALINILKNLLHVLKKIVRSSEDQDNLYGPIQDSFEYILNIGRPVNNKIIKYRSVSNEILQEIILNIFDKFYENLYSDKFEQKYVKIFEKLFMSSKGPDDLIKLHKFWDKFSDKFKSSILVKEVSAFLNSEQWFFCSNILKENFDKLEKKDHQFFWDLLSIGFSPAFLSRCFHKISDESFDKMLAGYGVKFLNSKVLEFVDGFSKHHEDISNSNINISQVFYENSNLLFSNPDKYLDLMIKEDIKNYCIKHKIIRKLNQACFILENNGKESDDFVLCSNKISESYNFNNDLFFGVFIILVKNSEPASLLRLRKLSSQIDVLMLPFAKARCELVSSSNSNSS